MIIERKAISEDDVATIGDWISYGSDGKFAKITGVDEYGFLKLHDGELLDHSEDEYELFSSADVALNLVEGVTHEDFFEALGYPNIRVFADENSEWLFDIVYEQIIDDIKSWEEDILEEYLERTKR